MTSDKNPRAEKLRQEIDRVVKAEQEKKAPASPAQVPRTLTPREFVQRRMQELDKKDGG